VFLASGGGGLWSYVHPEHQTQRGADTYRIRLAMWLMKSNLLKI